MRHTVGLSRRREHLVTEGDKGQERSEKKRRRKKRKRQIPQVGLDIVSLYLFLSGPFLHVLLLLSLQHNSLSLSLSLPLPLQGVMTGFERDPGRMGG
jgi:hypothetical protein